MSKEQENLILDELFGYFNEDTWSHGYWAELPEGRELGDMESGLDYVFNPTTQKRCLVGGALFVAGRLLDMIDPVSRMLLTRPSINYELVKKTSEDQVYKRVLARLSLAAEAEYIEITEGHSLDSTCNFDRVRKILADPDGIITSLRYEELLEICTTFNDGRHSTLDRVRVVIKRALNNDFD